VACLGCGLLRNDPIPSELELRQFYETTYRMSYKGVREPKPKHVARGGCLAVARFRALRGYLQGTGRVLDIGSGSGEWLYLLKRNGIDAIGLDPDPSWAAFSRRELGIDISAGTFNDARFPPQSFQMVTLFHVLEHLRDPVRAISQCLTWLTDKGHLIIEVPNLASPHQHPQKRFHPAHLFGFVPATLAFAARRAGGHPVEIRTDSFSRNITAVIRKSESAADAGRTSPGPSRQEVAEVLAAVKEQPLFTYYASAATFRRFVLRMRQFTREQTAVWQKRHAREILDTLFQDAAGDFREAEHR
jgi:SAM-dependent methyltransferase